MKELREGDQKTQKSSHPNLDKKEKIAISKAYEKSFEYQQRCFFRPGSVPFRQNISIKSRDPCLVQKVRRRKSHAWVPLTV